MNVFLKVCKYSLKVGKPQSLTKSKLFNSIRFIRILEQLENM